MHLTSEQVTALAPDASSASAGRKLATPSAWKSLGRSKRAVWGECQGSALYQVRVDLADVATKCSCPSRKFPCKHAIGLLALAATEPGLLPEADPPEWVLEWLGKRGGAAATQKDPAGKRTARVGTSRSRSADKRLARVAEGMDALDLWMSDLVRNGLATLETQSAALWERQAARMVDAQAPGVAARLRWMAGIPNSSPDWPQRLLSHLGRLALLTEAFRRLEQLDPLLQEDVRHAVGWTLTQEEVVARGEHVEDEWYVLGQLVTGDDPKLRTQWTWLLGDRTRRYALILQFSAAGRPFEASLIPGTCQRAVVAYWPSAAPQRGLVLSGSGYASPMGRGLPGFDTTRAFLTHVAEVTAQQPWLDRFPSVLLGVTPVRDEAGCWWVRDREEAALPLRSGEHWKLLALSGGLPVALSAEWDGHALLPLGVLVDGEYMLLEGTR